MPLEGCSEIHFCRVTCRVAISRKWLWLEHTLCNRAGGYMPRHVLFFFKYILWIMLFQWSHSFFLPFLPLRLVPQPPAFLPLNLCPWVVYVSYLASPFPILFLTSLCLFCIYQLRYLFPVPVSLFFPLPLPADNPPFPGFCSCCSCLLSFLGFFFGGGFSC